MISMLVCGVTYPVSAAAAGAMWVLGRVVYGYGYASGNPQGRMPGGIISHLGDIPLMVMTCRLAYVALTTW